MRIAILLAIVLTGCIDSNKLREGGEPPLSKAYRIDDPHDPMSIELVDRHILVMASNGAYEATWTSTEAYATCNGITTRFAAVDGLGLWQRVPVENPSCANALFLAEKLIAHDGIELPWFSATR